MQNSAVPSEMHMSSAAAYRMDQRVNLQRVLVSGSFISKPTFISVPTGFCLEAPGSDSVVS